MVPAAAIATLLGVAIADIGIGIIVATIAVNLILSAILGKILAPSLSNSGKAAKGLQTIIRSNIASRRVVYGETLVGGPYAYIETVGDTNEVLKMVIVLAGHPIEDILGVVFEDQYINIAGPGGTNNTSSGTNNLDTNYYVDEGKFGTGDAALHVRIIKVMGRAYADLSHVTDHTATEVVEDQQRTVRIDQAIHGVWDQPLANTRDSGTGLYATGEKLTNCAYIYIELLHNRDVFSGIPRMKFHVEGKRLYNPRKDGSKVVDGADSGGLHDLTDPDTYEYSNNWALCCLDYLLNTSYGLGAKPEGTSADPGEITWSDAIQAEVDSATVVTTGLPTPNAGTGPRFTINGSFEVNSTPISNMEGLLTSGAGELIYAQGEYKLRAGVYRAPNADTDIINEDMIISPLTIRTHTPRSDIFNKAGGVFVDKGYDDTATPTTTNQPVFGAADFALVDPLDSSGTNPFEVLDGEEIIREFDYPFTTAEFEAQRLARIQLERIRQGLIINFEANLKVLKYSVGDNIYLEILSDSKYANEAFFNRLGLDATVQTQDSPRTSPYYKQFKIIDMQYTEEFNIAVTLEEESEEIYDWNEGDANLTEHILESNLIIDDPTGEVLKPSWDLMSSPTTPITEVIEGSQTVSTELRWRAPERGSITNAIDKAHISRYEVQFGQVTNPSNADNALRVSNWTKIGITISITDNAIQGPISVENIFTDVNYSYDFRVRSITFSGRGSNWAYYNEDIGSDFIPAEPPVGDQGNEYAISVPYDTEVASLTIGTGWNPGEFRFNNGSSLTSYQDITEIELCILGSDNINIIETLEHVRWNDTITFHISQARWYKFKFVNSSPFNGQPGSHATSQTITDPTKIVYQYPELLLIDFKDNDPTNVDTIVTQVEFRLSRDRSDNNITFNIDGRFTAELVVLDGLEDSVHWLGTSAGASPNASNLDIGSGKDGSNAWFLEASDGTSGTRWSTANSIVMFKTSGVEFFNVTFIYNTLEGTDHDLGTAFSDGSVFFAELRGNNIPHRSGATSSFTNSGRGALQVCNTGEWKQMTIPLKVPDSPNNEWAYLEFGLYVNTTSSDAVIDVLIDSVLIEPFAPLDRVISLTPQGTNNYGLNYNIAQNFRIDLQDASSTATVNLCADTPTKAEVNIEITQGSTSRLISWEANGSFTNINWAGGTAPTLTTTNDAVDLITFKTVDQGTSWVGSAILNVS